MNNIRLFKYNHDSSKIFQYFHWELIKKRDHYLYPYEGEGVSSELRTIRYRFTFKHDIDFFVL